MLVRQSRFVFALITLLVVLVSKANCSQMMNLDQDKWHLWCDTKAEWKNDALYLPGEYKLSDLPVNPPTIGWSELYKAGIEVTLPTTVEEHFWGKFGKRDYTDDEYYFAVDDKQVKNGNYLGVSWWWTTFKCPKDISDKLASLHFDGARLRAEVFLNQQLVGYDMIGETPFDIDVTGKLKPGQENILAVRITNPGLRLDWMDGGTFKWGKYNVPISHGFGGINKGVRLEIKPKVYIDSAFVMNHSDPRQITCRCEVINTTSSPVQANLSISIIQAQVNQSKNITLPPGASTISMEISVPNAKLWSIENPNLYTCKASLACEKEKDSVDTKFGFRFLECRGIGRDAEFVWNGKRIVLKSAISWGYWGINGLWPDEKMAEKEVLTAKQIGLNCLNFHRCIGKPITLDIQDKLGLLRYEEPGSGGCIMDDDAFAVKYTEQKMLRMVKRDRNHPSLALYCIQNELGLESNDPRVEHILLKMHNIDPTRPIVFKSGVEPQGEAFILPYEDKIRKDNGSKYSGWCDIHTVGGWGVYSDFLYQGPDDWSHRSDNKKEIMFWGEMLGVGVPDNLQTVHDFYQKTGRTGYDRDDNAELYTAYDSFLAERGFKKAFPTVNDLTRSIGNRSYYHWGRILENGRICNNNDCMVVSGWESTSIENHSGIVDSHRNPKGDPQLMSYYCRPLHLAVKSRKLVIETGEPLITDYHIVNETGVSGSATLNLVVKGPDNKALDQRSISVKVTGGDVYGELLAPGIETNCYKKPGYYILEAALIQNNKTLVEGSERIFVVDNSLPALSVNGAICDYKGVAKKYLADRGLKLTDYFKDNPKLDYIIVAGDNDAGVLGGTEKTDNNIENTPDPKLYQTQLEGPPQEFWGTVNDIPNGHYKITFKFAELINDAPGMRVFDLAVNDETVINDLDIFKESGGKFKALDKTVEVDVTGHQIRITPPKVAEGLAVLNAFRIVGNGIDIGINCQGPAYKDSAGFAWSGNWHREPVAEDLIRRVREDGTTLIFWTNVDRAESIIPALDKFGVLKLSGHVGHGSAPWMGCWTVVKDHPLLKGLPVNIALNWEYQTAGADGFIIDGPGVEWISAYGKDHNRNIGTSLFTVAYGKGEIILNCMDDFYGALTSVKEKVAAPVARHLLLNTIEYACRRKN